MTPKATILLLSGFAALLFGCKKDNGIVPVDLGYDYFPTDTGRWIEYQVDSIWYDEEFGLSGSASYRMRETIFEGFTDPQGRPAQRIRRSIWNDSLNLWLTRDIWWQFKDSYAAEKTEENLRRLKLSFPVKESRYWNANVYNTQEEMEVTYGERDVPWSMNGMSFDSTVTVESTYFNNLVDTLIFEERYAKHVGMVHKQWERSNTQFGSGGPQTTGWKLTMVAVAFGG